MSLLTVSLLLSIIAIATYFQTVTGFGLAMIVIGVVSGFQLSSVAFIATVVSIISLINSGVALRGQLHHINWSLAKVTLLGIIPSSVLGVILLNYLSQQASSVLELSLGLVIAYSGIRFAFRPKQRQSISNSMSFFNAGFLSGLTGGLFAMPGPPIIFHMYRQPMSLLMIRYMLLLVFSVTALSRTVYEAFSVGLSENSIFVSLFAVPCVAISTSLAQRFPPPLSAINRRRLTFIVLVLIGLGLIRGALIKLL